VAAVTLAVRAAAVLHASWNALLKGVEDRLATVVLLDLTGLVVAAAVVLLAPVPAPASRGLLGLSVVLHLGYELLLLVAYRGGDLSQVYPVARGTAPLLVAAWAGLVLGERLAPVQVAGLGGVCAGLLVLAVAGRLRRHLPAGVAAGLLSVAAYGLVLWAQRRGALAVVAALRETSVLVAVLIGTLVFGERFGRRRVLAAALLAAGIVALNVPR
jgi:drug/metabolite transporter (DMT)-like permease